MDITTVDQFRQVFDKVLKDKGLKSTFKNNERVVRDVWENPDKSEEYQALFQFMSPKK